MDCEIKDDTKLIIQPASYEHGTQQRQANYDLFVDSVGEVVSGNRAYFNHKYFNVTILPKLQTKLPERKTNSSYLETKSETGKAGNRHYISAKKVRREHLQDEENFNSRIFCQFSFPRWKKETNINPLKQSEHIEVLKYVEKELKDIGIKTNIMNSDVSRLDQFTNLTTIEPYPTYAPIFDLLQLSRKKSIGWNNETFLWKSNEQEITIYDKVNEMKSKIKDEKVLNSIKQINNIMRIENRLSTKRKIFSKYGMRNTATVFNNFDFIRKVYKDEIENTIFKYEKNDIEYLTIENIKQSLQNFCDSGRRYWFRNFLVYNGYLSLIKLTSPEIILQAIDEMDIPGSHSRSRVIKHRIKKTFNEAKTGFNLNRNSIEGIFKSNKSFIELYHEIKDKFKKAA